MLATRRAALGDGQGCIAGAERNQLWPQHHVSYDGFSDVAAWVREKSDTRCGISLYSFATQAESGGVRLWRLAPGGHLRIRLGVDEDLDGSPDATDLEDTRRTGALRPRISPARARKGASARNRARGTPLARDRPSDERLGPPAEPSGVVDQTSSRVLADRLRAKHTSTGFGNASPAVR